MRRSSSASSSSSSSSSASPPPVNSPSIEVHAVTHPDQNAPPTPEAAKRFTIDDLFSKVTIQSVEITTPPPRKTSLRRTTSPTLDQLLNTESVQSVEITTPEQACDISREISLCPEGDSCDDDSSFGGDTMELPDDNPTKLKRPGNADDIADSGSITSDKQGSEPDDSDHNFDEVSNSTADPLQHTPSRKAQTSKNFGGLPPA